MTRIHRHACVRVCIVFEPQDTGKIAERVLGDSKIM